MNDSLKKYERILKGEKITLTDKIFYFPREASKPRRVELDYLLYWERDKRGIVVQIEEGDPFGLYFIEGDGKGIILLADKRNASENLIKAICRKYEIKKEVWKNKKARELAGEKLEELREYFYRKDY